MSRVEDDNDYCLICKTCEERINLSSADLSKWLELHGHHTVLYDYSYRRFDEKYPDWNGRSTIG
jgi:hypothetical protein